MAGTKNFGQIQQTLGQAGSIIGNLGKVGASWAGAYLNVPQAQSIDPYLAQAAQVGNTRFGSSSMAGLMSQWRNTPNLKVLTRKDLFNPSSSETLGLDKALRASGYASDFANSVENFANNFPTQPPQKTSFTPRKSNPQNMTAEDLAGAQSNEEKYDIAGQMASSSLESGIYKDMSVAAANTLPTDADGNPIMEPQIPQNSNNGWITSSYQAPYNFGANFKHGGHLFFGGGDIGFNWGNVGSTAAEVLSGGVATLLNWAGNKNQMDIADARAGEYNAARLYAEQLKDHNFGNKVVDTYNNMFNMQALNMKAQGGALQTQGAEFPLDGDFNIIGAGGTHEINPMGGVQQGVSRDGAPNLVEEGEVVWNDYVFSDSRREDKKHKNHPQPDLMLPEGLLKKYKGLTANMTFADAAKKLAEEAKERPNDPISQLGLQTFMAELKETQEQVKQEKEAEQLKKAINKMSPEELMALQQILQQEAPIEQEPQMPQQQMEQQMPQQMPELPQQPIFAFGGKLFAGTSGASGASATPSQVGKMESEGIFLINGKRYRVDESFANDFRSGNIHVSVGTDGKIVAKKAPSGYKYNEQGAMVKVGSGSGSGTTVVSEGTEPTYQATYTNRGNFLDDNGQLNSSRMDRSKTESQVRAREAEDLYERTNQYIRQQLANYVAGVDTDLSNVDPKLVAKLKEIDNQFTRGKVDDVDRLFNADGVLRRDVLNVLLDRKTSDGKLNGLRTDGKEGPNHWSAEWLDTPPQEVPYDWSWEEWKPTEREKERVQQEETPYFPLSTWQRYAPIAGAAMGMLPQNPKDYSTMMTPRTAHYIPIGDYLEYNPTDTQRYLNVEDQQALAQMNAIMNATGANRNMAMAQMALANRNRQQGRANVMNGAETINFAQRAQVGEFNRGTNQFNAGAHNQAELANLGINQILLNQDQTNQRMRYMVDKDIDAARSASMNAFLTSLGNIGKENFYVNQVNSNKALYYGIDGNPLFGGSSYYKAPTKPASETDEEKAVRAALGGKLLTNTKRNRRR